MVASQSVDFRKMIRTVRCRVVCQARVSEMSGDVFPSIGFCGRVLYV